MNSSVPPVSPPLIAAALTRMATITPTIAQNSVVLNACFVSVARRRTLPTLTPVLAGVAAVAASTGSLLVFVGLARQALRPCVCPEQSGAAAQVLVTIGRARST